jgi:hypothetical protein
VRPAPSASKYLTSADTGEVSEHKQLQLKFWTSFREYMELKQSPGTEGLILWRGGLQGQVIARLHGLARRVDAHPTRIPFTT